MIQPAPETDRFKDEMSKSSILTKETPAEAPEQLDKDQAKDFGWESNRDEENPEHLPWPEENESKE